MQAQLAYLPRTDTIRTGDLMIEPLPDLGDKFAQIEASSLKEGDWIYPPYPARIFSMPKTHTMSHSSAADLDLLYFLAYCLGFFVGTRITLKEAGFVDATPAKPGKLCDFTPLVGERLQNALAKSEAFWNQYRTKPEASTSLRGAIHCLWLSFNPRLLDYERFIYVYTAMEGSYVTHCRMQGLDPLRHVRHGKRVDELCALLRIIKPTWASDAIKIRSEALHESTLMKEPLGFRVLPDGYVRQMQSFVCRCIVALLGIDDRAYVEGPMDRFLTHGLTPPASPI